MFIPYSCPSCSHSLLRHVNMRGIYWRCGHCRENFSANHPYLTGSLQLNHHLQNHHLQNNGVSLSSLSSLERLVSTVS